MKSFKTFIVERELYSMEGPSLPPGYQNLPNWQSPIYYGADWIPGFGYPPNFGPSYNPTPSNWLGQNAPTEPHIPYPANSYRGPLSDPETRDLIRYIQQGGWKPGDPPPPAPPGWTWSQWLGILFGVILPLFINQEAGGYGDEVVIPTEQSGPQPNKPIQLPERLPGERYPGEYQEYNWML